MTHNTDSAVLSLGRGCGCSFQEKTRSQPAGSRHGTCHSQKWHTEGCMSVCTSVNQYSMDELDGRSGASSVHT